MRITNLVIVAIALAFIVGFVGTARAESAAKKNLDLDGDGKIDHGELKHAIKLILIEKGEAGKIIELGAEERVRLNELHDRLDQDKNGVADPSLVRDILHRIREHHPKLFARIKEKLRELKEKSGEKAAGDKPAETPFKF